MKKGFLLAGDYSAYEREMAMAKQLFAKLNIDIEVINFNDVNVIAFHNDDLPIIQIIY